MFPFLEQGIEKIENLAFKVTHYVKKRVALSKFLIQSWLLNFISQDYSHDSKLFRISTVFVKLLDHWTNLDRIRTLIYSETELEELLCLKLHPRTQKLISDSLVGAYRKRFLHIVRDI